MEIASRILAVALAGILLALLACGSDPTHTPDPPPVVRLTEQQMEAVMLSPREIKAEFPDLIFYEVESGPLPILLSANPSIEVRNEVTPTPAPGWQAGYTHNFHSTFFFPSDAPDAVFAINSQINALESSEAATRFIDIALGEDMERLSEQPVNIKIHSIESIAPADGIGEAFGGYRTRFDIPRQGLYMREYYWYWKRENIVLSVYLMGSADTDHEATIERLARTMDARLANVAIRN